MAFTFGFYNSLNHDRVYNAEQVSSIFDGLITDGVFDTIGEIFAVVPESGMQVNLKTGKAWFNHTWNVNDSWMPLFVEPADVLLNRYDTVVIDVDARDTARTNSIKIVKGIASLNPEKPTLANMDKWHQHPLAHILVEAGTEAITAANIEIVVGTSACPFVTGLLETVPIDDLYQQWEAEFDTWFANLKAQLTDNVVTNLQNQIDEVKEEIDQTTAILRTEIKTASSIGWRLIQQYLTPGSYTWIAPNLNNGKPYKIGRLLIGGGGSGGVIGSSLTSHQTTYASGGGSGKSYYDEIEVSPNSSHYLVVGSGGDPAVINLGANTTAYNFGNLGGTTTFDGVVATGGNGGKYGSGQYGSNACGGADGGQPSAATGKSSTSDFGGATVCFTNSSTHPAQYRTGTPTMCYNPFEHRRILCAGGGADTDYSYPGGVDPKTNKRGGNGGCWGNSGEMNATDIGGGGGGLAVTVTSGAPGYLSSGRGGNGGIYIYVFGL